MVRGGKRDGSGRPKGEGSKIVRVPLGCLARVEAIIQIYKEGDCVLKGHSPFVESKFNKKSSYVLKKNKSESKQENEVLPSGMSLDLSTMTRISKSGYRQLARKQKRIIDSRVKKGKCKII